MGKHPPFKAERSDGRARTQLVSFRLLPEGEAVLNQISYEKGMSRAAYIRGILGQHLSTLDTKELLRRAALQQGGDDGK